MMKKKGNFLLISLAIFLFSPVYGNSAAAQLAHIDPSAGGSISKSGNYYLGFDITENIDIEADNVTLNLNGHTVQQINIVSHNSINIFNGIIDGTTISAGSVLTIIESTNIQVSDVSVKNGGKGVSGNTNGVGISGSSDVFLSRLLSYNNTSCGCRIENQSATKNRNIFLFECTFYNNDDEGVLINNDTPSYPPNLGNASIILSKCISFNNDFGFGVVANSVDIIFEHCIALQNLDTGFFIGGFVPGTITSSILIECIAEFNFGDGFYTDNLSFSILEKCLSKNNTRDGFNMNGSAQVGQESFGIVKECTAQGNQQCGFNDRTGALSKAKYVANFATNNGTMQNYCINGVNAGTAAPFSAVYTSDGPAFWRNTAPSA